MGKERVDYGCLVPLVTTSSISRNVGLITVCIYSISDLYVVCLLRVRVPARLSMDAGLVFPVEA